MQHRELFKIFFDEEGELSPEQRAITVPSSATASALADEVRTMLA